jgi:fructose-1,6-bisphosphatase/inositol monophosphatase family enzyme
MEYKEFAVNLARESGDIIRQNFTLGMKKEWKEDRSPVTVTDLKINQLVIDRVRENFPDHNVKGEEQSFLENKSDFLWVCDPVDGTIPFSHSVPICAFSLALVKNGESILGVIYDALMDRMYFAGKGKGAFLNEKPIKVTKSLKLERSLVDVVFFNTARYQIKNLPQKLIEAGAIVSKLGSETYAGGLVASGEYIASIFPHYTAHDVAAIKIIVEEAGGKVTDIFGNEQRYDQDIKGAIVSNGYVHDQLVKLIQESMKS